MTSLRDSINTLQRYSRHGALNLSDVYEFLMMKRPLTVGEIIHRIQSLPDSVPFSTNIVTDVAMGGEVSLTLNRDGTYQFRGSMRAHGAFSFSFRVGVVVRSGSGQVALAVQHTGEVFGTDTPGKRQDDWDEAHGAEDLSRVFLLRNLWPDISRGSQMTVRTTADVTGTLGTAENVIKDVAEVFIVAETLGVNLAICVVIGSELGKADPGLPGLAGVIGIGVIAGGLFIWGPLAIGPAFILGVAAELIVAAMVKVRPLEIFEIDFAKQVFRDSLDFERIRITNLVGLGGRPFTLPTVDDHILINIGVSDAMFDAPYQNRESGVSHSGAAPDPRTDSRLADRACNFGWRIRPRLAVRGRTGTGVHRQNRRLQVRASGRAMGFDVQRGTSSHRGRLVRRNRTTGAGQHSPSA